MNEDYRGGATPFNKQMDELFGINVNSSPTEKQMAALNKSQSLSAEANWNFLPFDERGRMFI